MARKIEVVPHDPRWREAFQAEEAELASLLGGEVVAVHHIGSTAVPGLAAKPIVDVLVEVRQIGAIDPLAGRLAAMGYLPRGENGIPGRRYFIKGSAEERTHHVHVFQAGDPQVERHLALRDYLIAHPAEAEAYGRLKMGLAVQFPEDAHGYVDGKDAFVRELEQRALAWRRGALAGLTVDAMRPEDWPAVRAIYQEGIAAGNATFETGAPEWEEWDGTHRPDCRLVARRGDQVVGWAALSPVSGRCVYGGVAEVSVYVAGSAQGQGVGRALLGALVEESERAGIWTLQAGIFPENAASLALHRRCGFREIGRRERLGQHHGVWRDVVLMERRSQVVGVCGGSCSVIGG